MDFSTTNIGTRFTTLIRSDFWFSDGNIVLISSSAAFKVHRGHLARHSEVFDDLFSVPQPEDQELLDGCLWVELHDCPSDVYYFLQALYDGLYLETRQAGDFPAIAAVLRLSTKYLVEHLRQRCLNRLELDWPSTLAGWDLREQEATDDTGEYIPRDLYAHPILLMKFAMELGLYSILPAAFYDLSRYGPSRIMLGTVPAPSEFDLAFDSPTQANDIATPVHLSPDLLYRTLFGRECAQRFVAGFIERELKGRAPSAGCTNSNGQNGGFDRTCPCRESFYFVTLNVLRSVGGIASGRDADALFSLTQAMDMLYRTDFSDGQKQCGLKICRSCKADFSESVKKAREEVWALIPMWFGLDSRAVRK